MVVNTYDETHTIIPVRKIARRIRAEGGRGLVILAGVQTNQFPRAADLARQFRAEGVAVAIGGFHVSGCLAMLAEMPPELRELQEMGVTLFAGEAEGRMEQLLADACAGRLQPVYNYLQQLPELQGQVTPFLPREQTARTMFYAAFDAGRGCPFACSFCTIINVQGRKSRWRTADDVERLVRANVAQGIHRFFISDDNMAQNENWEAIFDRLIELRERERIRIKFTMQVDMMCHKVPGFIDKACRAGCTRVLMGLENIQPANLAAAGKRQNQVPEYREMLQAWRARRVVTYAGYILGFPADTPESIRQDIATIQRELPIDILEFFVLTPLPGSANHKALVERGQWLDPDLNRYDAEHVTTLHPRMSARSGPTCTTRPGGSVTAHSTWKRSCGGPRRAGPACGTWPPRSWSGSAAIASRTYTRSRPDFSAARSAPRGGPAPRPTMPCSSMPVGRGKCCPPPRAWAAIGCGWNSCESGSRTTPPPQPTRTRH